MKIEKAQVDGAAANLIFAIGDCASQHDEIDQDYVDLAQSIVIDLRNKSIADLVKRGLPSADFRNLEHVKMGFNPPTADFLEVVLSAMMSGAALLDLYDAVAAAGYADPRDQKDFDAAELAAATEAIKVSGGIEPDPDATDAMERITEAYLDSAEKDAAGGPRCD